MYHQTTFKIRNAVRHLNAGEVIAYPTEAVYGLGCDPLNELAVRRLLEIKQRPMNKGLILIASSIEQLHPFLLLTETILERVTPTWPGAVTWLIPSQAWVPEWLTGEHKTLAVRVTKHPIARQLCAAYGAPIVSTSANTSAKPAVKKARNLKKALSGHRLFVVHGEVGTLKQETAIYDAVSGNRLR